MTPRRHGWTIAELLVSIAVLALLLVLVAQSLSMTQRSWLSARASAEMMRSVEDTQSTMTRHISLATLQPRQRFDSTTGILMPESDLHFICGPATELLPDLPGASGDAIFFQHPANEGSLPNALQGCGFFVQYSDDSSWRPAFLRSVAPRRRFRLMHFHQPAAELSLFRPPALSSLTKRRDLYSWFAQPIGDSHAGSVSMIADNVIAMKITPEAGTRRCYDTRRHQWGRGTIAASATRHRLPQSVGISLLLTDEASWSKLDADTAETLAATLKRIIEKQDTSESSPQPAFAALSEVMNAYQMKTRTVSWMVPLVY